MPELALLRDALNSGDTAAIADWSAPIQARRQSTRAQRFGREASGGHYRSGQPASKRLTKFAPKRSAPALSCRPGQPPPSAPSPRPPRSAACAWTSKKGNLDANRYRTGIAEHIKQAIVEQERLGLDVLVHGEAERNDMVEYFGEHLDGFIFTQNGWVQSYGSRCVKRRWSSAISAARRRSPSSGQNTLSP